MVPYHTGSELLTSTAPHMPRETGDMSSPTIENRVVGMYLGVQPDLSTIADVRAPWANPVLGSAIVLSHKRKTAVSWAN